MSGLCRRERAERPGASRRDATAERRRHVDHPFLPPADDALLLASGLRRSGRQSPPRARPPGDRRPPKIDASWTSWKRILAICCSRISCPSATAWGLDQLVPMVKSRVRQTAIDRYRYFMAVHAGVVGNGERCLMFPGAPGRGKTTLTAALSRGGFHYFSDEFALRRSARSMCPPSPWASPSGPARLDS